MPHFCLLCMKRHTRMLVTVSEEESDGVRYSATYEYCPETDEHLETEELMRKNSLAYRAAKEGE